MSSGTQVAHMQAQLLAAQATQAGLQARIMELESMLSGKQPYQLTKSVLCEESPQPVALLTNNTRDSPLKASSCPKSSVVPPPPLLPLNLSNVELIGMKKQSLTSSASGSSPPQSASPRSSPSPPQSTSPTPSKETPHAFLPTFPRVCALGTVQSVAAAVTPAAQQPPTKSTGKRRSRSRRNKGLFDWQPTIEWDHVQAFNPKSMKQLPPMSPPTTAASPAVVPLPPSPSPRPVFDTPTPGTMLDLLCSAAVGETLPAPMSSTVSQEAQVLPQDIASTHVSASGSSDSITANERLARALSGVGATGSLARIRQQLAGETAAGAAAGDESSAKPINIKWHPLLPKRRRIAK